jgi:stearoyl-CoA desaturase (delta-9 desaturase)
MQGTISFIVWFFVFYLYHGLGTTLGYHRLLTHKALKTPAWLKYFIVSGGYLGLMGAPIPWVGIHRQHHQKSDMEGDPHSPRDGFKHALYQWMFDATAIQSNEELHAQTADLMSDKRLTWLGTKHDAEQAQMCLAFCIAFRVLILCTLGVIPLLANLAATIFTFWSTQFVNVFCHMKSQGYRSHDTRDLSRNVWWVGILALGEGWHNNHHAVPKSARHGFAWFEFDVTWYTIWLLEKLGLAKTVIRPPGFSLENLKAKINDLAMNNLVMPKQEAALEPVSIESAGTYNSKNLVT